jgi:dTMP kinase
MAPATIKDLATAASEAAAAMSSSLQPDHNEDAPAPTSPAPEVEMSVSGQQDSREAGGEGVVSRGALVVLEGLDRSGKTTQVKLLEQRFVELGRKVKVMRFPGTLWFVHFWVSLTMRMHGQG